MKKKYILLFILVSLMFFSKVEAYEEYKIGDKVDYKGENYYVISDSDEDTNYVTLLKEKSLTVDEINKYGRDESGKLFVNSNSINQNDPEKVIYEFNDNIGGIAYYNSDGCSSLYYYNGSSFSTPERDNSKCTSDYNSSDIKKIVDNWAKDNFNSNDLIEVDGYSSRLLNYDDLYIKLESVDLSNPYSMYWSIKKPKWFKSLIAKQPFWVMSKRDNLSYEVDNLRENFLESISVFSISSVKPVINLNKCLLDDSDKECIVDKNENLCDKTVTKYNEYKVCDTVEYNGDKYYVMQKSSSNQNYVSLLKVKPLTPTDINNDSSEVIGKSAYTHFLNLKDKGENEYGTTNNFDYDLSYVKIVVDNWKNSELDDNDLVNVDGYKVRLIDKDDVINLNNNSIVDYSVNYWAMYNYYCYYSSYGKYFPTNYAPNDANFEEKAIRPVINLKKEKIANLSNYEVGDIVSYKNNDYYIIKISDENYVTLFKKDALTQSQVNKYGEAYLTTYNNALEITDNWSAKFKNDLVNVKGRSSGLLTLSDLFEKFNYDYCLVNSSSRICKTDLTPSCLDSDYWYWITDDGKYSLSEDQADKNLSMGPYVISWNSNKNLAVRPMLNVKKCAIDGGCYDEKILCEEEPQIKVEPEERIEKEPEKEKTIIEAENTFKTVSYILIIIGSLLIIGGYILYKRIKKINN